MPCSHFDTAVECRGPQNRGDEEREKDKKKKKENKTGVASLSCVQHALKRMVYFQEEQTNRCRCIFFVFFSLFYRVCPVCFIPMDTKSPCPRCFCNVVSLSRRCVATELVSSYRHWLCRMRMGGNVCLKEKLLPALANSPIRRLAMNSRINKSLVI